MATQQWKHQVFISFSGKDTRRNFVCHLDDALRRKGLKTFVDDQLRRGEEINTALLQAIQDSKVALIIFSVNYASSRWCLDELLKIIEFHKTHRQIVIPVFYRVTPSDVRNQNGSFGKSFAEHSENAGYSKWKAALTEAANISGRDSDVIREDNKLIDQIVRDVLEKLKLLDPCSLEGFVGLKSKIRQVKTLLATGSSEVRMLGIWGMGGIGKTTLAEAIFNEVSSQFEGSCFVRKVEASEEGSIKLLEKLISDLLEERDVKIDTPNVGPGLYFLKRLKRKRVFVVFDDVSNPLQLEYLIGNQYWLGAGSNIIITSRDKQVFQGINGINIYEVEALSGTESHQLFVRYAFKEEQPSQDHIPLIGSFVNYARGNPLAIKVLGSSICGKEVKIWRDALKKLSKCPNKYIQNVLKLSYDGLDGEEKAIFLHIACFFNGENKNEAKSAFTSFGFSADIGVSRLVDKSLVTISIFDTLDMHDLLQDMGREIVREESKDRRYRSRYWDAEEIRRVFEENEGPEAIEIESIRLNTSQIRDDIELDPNVFKRMPNLKFLKFYNSLGKRSKLHLTRGLRFLPSRLRYLYWDKYPLESLPTDFDAKELVVLHLPGSNIKQILKDGGKLKMVAQSLIESPLISRVTDIVFGKLPFGIGNIRVPSSSCQFFSKITHMDMEGCKNLKSFPSNVDLQCLEILNLKGCSNLKIFPEISTNLRELNLEFTAIKEVHSSSIEGLSGLQVLNMYRCEKLESLPSNICKLQSLWELDLAFCSSLKKFPEILEPMYNLKRVQLSESGIEAIPSSIDNMKGLEILDLANCLNLACFPEGFFNLVRRIAEFWFSTACEQLKKPRNLLKIEEFEECFFFSISPWSHPNFDTKVTINRQYHMTVKMTTHVSECLFYLIDLPYHPALRFLSPYYILNLSSYRIRELPKELGFLYYLRELDLGSSDFEEIPASIKQLSLLQCLQLADCPKLRSLPQLPTSLHVLNADNCESLKTLLAFKQPIFNGGAIDFKQPIFNGCLMNFGNCLKLKKKECECEAMAYKLLRNGPKDVYLCYPGSRITEWFRHQTTGDIIRIKLPTNWFCRFLGFAFCVVLKSVRGSNLIKFECYFENNYNPTILFPYQSHPIDRPFVNCSLKHQHVFVWCFPDFNVWISERRQLFRLHCINMASFKFSICGRAKIKKCGITRLYTQVDEGCSGIAPLYMQVDEGYVQGDDDDQDDADENAYWMLKSLLPRKMSTKMKMKLKKKIKDYDEDMNSEDSDDDMISEDDEDEFFETEDGLSEANDELSETTTSRD